MRHKATVYGARSSQKQVPKGPVDLRRTTTQNPRRVDENAEEDAGVNDPFLDGVILENPSTQLPDDDESVADVPIGIPANPADFEQPDDGLVDPNLGEPFGFENETDSNLAQEDECTDSEFDWGTLEPLSANEIADAADGPIEESTQPLDPMQPLTVDDAGDEEPISSAMPVLQIDDGKLMWAKERWSELPLPVTFSARQSLALVGAALCAAGDATHVVSTRELVQLEAAPLSVKVRRAICLDPKAQILLLVTVTGQLAMWQRAPTGRGEIRWLPVPNGEVISGVWQQAPGVARLLFRMESGALYAWDAERAQLGQIVSLSDKSRPSAISELGEPMVALLQGHNAAQLAIEGNSSRQKLLLTEDMYRAIATARPMLASLADYVFLGVREHGLFLAGPGRGSFCIVPGCRGLTAFTVGQLHERPTAFVGVFSELEDRSDIVAIDLATVRVARIAEICVHTDRTDSEDDPPERARIDAMLWDPAHLRLWAAGGFGLATFSPPPKPSSS